MKKYFQILFFAILFNLIKAKYHNNVFSEELVIKELNNNYVNSYFQFTTQWNYKTNENDLLHTDLLSRSLSELFLRFDIVEIHITLSNGLWRNEFWGYPIESAGAGGEVYAWFKNHLSQEEISQQWIELNEALSGLLCASFSFVENTISPHYTYRPTSAWNVPLNSSFIRYAALPREVVCTENLTPWKKLLPCDTNDGFISLLNGQYIYSTNYHSLGIHVRQLCIDKACTNAILESKQTVNLVSDLKLFGGTEWSIRKLFGQGLNGACALSSNSKIYLDITDKDFEITPKPINTIVSKRGGTETIYAEFDVKKLAQSNNKMMNIAIANKKHKTIPISAKPPIYAKRYLLGTGKERGKIVNEIHNTHRSSLNVVILENIPWFVPIYLHTLKLTVGSAEIKPTFIKYIPGVQRKRAYHLEIGCQIPPKSKLLMKIDFDYIFLRWNEYRPDANHGEYIPSSIISVNLPSVALNYTSAPIDASLYSESFNATRPSYFLRIHTEALLINLPTPDFSMPYNVICLTCTVVALCFGPLHNMTTKHLILQKKDDTKKSFFAKLKEKLFKKKEKAE